MQMKPAHMLAQGAMSVIAIQNAASSLLLRAQARVRAHEMANVQHDAGVLMLDPIKETLRHCRIAKRQARPLYGFILDTWTLVGFVSDMNAGSVLATYGTGAVTNFASAIATVVFLVPIADSWPRMFRRIKEKYRIGPATSILFYIVDSLK